MQMSSEWPPKYVFVCHSGTGPCPTSLFLDLLLSHLPFWMTLAPPSSSWSLASSPCFLPAPCPLSLIPLASTCIQTHLPQPHSVPLVFLDWGLWRRGGKGMATSPVSPSASRFHPASSAGALALNLISQSVRGNKETATIIHGKETTPYMPCVSPLHLVAVNGSRARDTITTKPELPRLFQWLLLLLCIRF